MVNKRIRRLVTLLGVASHCFSDVNATEKSLAAQFDGTKFRATIHNEGNIFEIVAKSQPISVTRFDININDGTDTIEVKSRPGVPGRVVDLDDDGWAPINSFPGVVGQGKNNVTPLPEFDVPVTIPAGSKQAFYITTTVGYAPVDIYYSIGSLEGRVYDSNDDLELLEGHAVVVQNGYTVFSTPRRWNGIVHYSVSGDEPTTSPVPTTPPVEAPKPSLAPSYSPSNDPTSSPKSAPTISPVQMVPTSSPTTSPPTQSPLSNDPNKSPSSTPSTYPSLLPMAKFASSSPTVAQRPTNNPSEQPMTESASSGVPSAMPSQIVDNTVQTQSPSTSLNPTNKRNLTVKPRKAPFSSAQRMYESSSLLTCLSLVICMGFI